MSAPLQAELRCCRPSCAVAGPVARRARVEGRGEGGFGGGGREGGERKSPSSHRFSSPPSPHLDHAYSRAYAIPPTHAPFARRTPVAFAGVTRAPWPAFTPERPRQPACEIPEEARSRAGRLPLPLVAACGLQPPPTAVAAAAGYCRRRLQRPLRLPRARATCPNLPKSNRAVQVRRSRAFTLHLSALASLPARYPRRRVRERAASRFPWLPPAAAAYGSSRSRRLLP